MARAKSLNDESWYFSDVCGEAPVRVNMPKERITSQTAIMLVYQRKDFERN
jgi:hypothetical protein